MSRTVDSLFLKYGPAYRWLATATVISGTLTTALSTTIVNVVIPDIMGIFGVGQDKGQWMSTAFLAANTASMLVNAWCVHAYGQRKTFIAAMLFFIFGSILGGLGQDINTLILARVIQGAAAGLLQPLAMQMMFRVFPEDQRGNAMGYFGIGVILAPAFGPTLGGVLADNFNWRAVFFVAPTVGILAIGMAAVFLPDREDEGPARRFDWTGLALLCTFLLTVLTALSNGQREGWYSDYIVTLFSVGFVSAAAFLWWELNSDRPLLQLRVYSYPGFASAAGVSIIYGIGLFGSTYIFPLFVQLQLGYTPTLSGLMLMPAGLVMGMLFLPMGRLSDHVRPHYMIIIGFVIFALSSLLLYDADVDTTFWTMASMIMLGRIGLTFIMPAVSVGGMGSLPPHLMGQGSGAINFTRQLGGAFGVNLLSVYMSARTDLYADFLAATQIPDNSTTQALIRSMAQLYAQSGVSEAHQNAGAVQYLAQMVAAKASMFAFRDAFIVVGIIFLLGIIPALVLGRFCKPRGRRVPMESNEADAELPAGSTH